MLEAQKVGVPVIKLIKGIQGFLTTIPSQNKKDHCYVSEFFDGENFENKSPTIFEMVEITKYLARLNTLQFPVEETYDSWGNKNLLKEYELNNNKIPSEVNELLLPTIAKLSKLDFNNFSKSVIHGDMQRKHVLKNKKGEFCILDFGCASYDGKVFDLSTYLAWFCIGNDTWENKDRIYQEVIKEYTNHLELSEYELEAIPILTEASYSAYYLKTYILLKEGDKGKETLDWHNSAKNMLHKFREKAKTLRHSQYNG